MANTFKVKKILEKETKQYKKVYTKAKSIKCILYTLFILFCFVLIYNNKAQGHQKYRDGQEPQKVGVDIW